MWQLNVICDVDWILVRLTLSLDNVLKKDIVGTFDNGLWTMNFIRVSNLFSIKDQMLNTRLCRPNCQENTTQPCYCLSCCHGHCQTGWPWLCASRISVSREKSLGRPDLATSLPNAALYNCIVPVLKFLNLITVLFSHSRVLVFLKYNHVSTGGTGQILYHLQSNCLKA